MLNHPELEALRTNAYPESRLQQLTAEWHRCIQADDTQYFVIDDDPTGGQTVHDVPVFTAWDEEHIRRAFLTGSRLLYIMTNSRSMTAQETSSVHKTLLENIKKQAVALNRKYAIISRGDSTLRGHYPLETDLIKSVTPAPVKELLIPMFPEGDRITVDDIHYLLDNGKWLPCSESDYAQDRTFGYQSANLKQWIVEKSHGRYSLERIGSVPLELLRSQDYEKITAILTSEQYDQIVVNAVVYEDLKVFSIAYFRASQMGIHFVARTAAAWPRVIGGIDAPKLLSPSELLPSSNSSGGLIIVGSHVKKTTQQLMRLLQNGTLTVIEFNQHLILDSAQIEREIRRVAEATTEKLRSGCTVVVHTKRKRLDLPGESEEAQLRITNQISQAFTSCISQIPVRPAFVITKGGITSSDILVRAMQTRAATILGQIYPGVPVWRLSSSSKFPEIPFIIFPGNVGQCDTLANIVSQFCFALSKKAKEKPS